LDIEGGEVSDINYKEFLISTYEGKVIGFGEKFRRKIVNQIKEKS